MSAARPIQKGDRIIASSLGKAEAGRVVDVQNLGTPELFVIVCRDGYGPTDRALIHSSQVTHDPDAVTCSSCPRRIDRLEVFPGGRCLDCHKATRPPMPTAHELARVWGAR